MRYGSALASARERAAWLVVALLPVVTLVSIWLLGYLKLAKLAAMGAMALAAAAVIFLRPRWGLYFMLWYIYSGVGLFLPINLAAVTMVIVVAAVLLEWVRGDVPEVPDTYFWIAVGLFILIALHSMLVARDIPASLQELAQFGKVVMFVVLVTHLLRTPEHLRRLAYWVFVGAVSTVILGVLGVMLGLEGAGDNYIGGVRIMRFTGAHENPNKAAAVMASALPFGFFVVRHCRTWLMRIAATAGVVTLFLGIFATFSRSAIFPVTLILVGVAAHEFRSRRSFGLLALLLTIGVLVAPRYYWERVLDVPNALKSTTRDWSVYTRMLALQTAWDMFLHHPLTGVGLGNFMMSSAHRLFVRIVVHNTYLEILVGTGIAGLITFLTMLSSGWRHALRGARHQWQAHPQWMRSLSYYILLSSLSICLSAGFGTMPFRYPLWVPVAAALAVGNLLRAEKRAET
jgi:O-antigen ligase